MLKRINEAFVIEDFIKLTNSKEDLKKELGLSRLSWHDYLLHISNVKIIK